MPNKIHYNDLLEDTKTNYTNLLHKWGNHPTAKEQALMNKVSSLEARLANVDQKLSLTNGNGGSNGSNKAPNPKHKDLTCHNCGEKGHISPNCPKKKSSGSSNNSNNSSNGSGNSNNRNNNNNAATGKWAPPKEGEPLEKMIDGVLMHYCKDCGHGKGRWTNHKTEDHVPGYLRKKKNAEGANTASLPPAAAAHLAAGNQQLMCWDTWNS